MIYNHWITGIWLWKVIGSIFGQYDRCWSAGPVLVLQSVIIWINIHMLIALNKKNKKNFYINFKYLSINVQEVLFDILMRLTLVRIKLDVDGIYWTFVDLVSSFIIHWCGLVTVQTADHTYLVSPVYFVYVDL